MEYSPWVFKCVAPVSNPQQRQLAHNDGITIPTGGQGFFTPQECEKIITLSKSVKQHDAITGDGQGGHDYSRRKSWVREVYPHPDWNWVFEKLEQALIQLNNQQYKFNVSGFYEGAQIYEYPPGGHLGWHMDVARGYMSNRKLSMTVQLSESADYEGGNLEFMDFKETAPRGIGDLIVFPSYLMHRVSALTSGTRHVWVSWVHGPAYK